MQKLHSTEFEKTVLVTGGLGFIASAFLREYVPLHKNWLFVNFDDFRGGSNVEAVAEVETEPNYRFERCALEDEKRVIFLMLKHGVTDVIHFAADSDVDHSIREPIQTLYSNACGTINLLEGVRALKTMEMDFNRFVYVSTDEVYGPLGLDDKPRKETDAINPKNPYSATKASGEHLVQAYSNTYGIDVVITRGTNTFGPWQQPTKVIPRAVRFLVNGQRVQVYGDGLHRRSWMPVRCHTSGIRFVWLNGLKGIYNISVNKDIPNYDMLFNVIVKVKGEVNPEDFMEFVTDRPGHDRRYAIDSSKLRSSGWAPPINVATDFNDTIQWYKSYWQKHKVSVK